MGWRGGGDKRSSRQFECACGPVEILSSQPLVNRSSRGRQILGRSARAMRRKWAGKTIRGPAGMVGSANCRGCAVKEDRSQGLLPQSPAPGTHGNESGPLQAVMEGIAFFAGKSLWSDLAIVGCHNVGN